MNKPYSIKHDNKVADATAVIQQPLVKTPKPEPILSDLDLEFKRQLHESLDKVESKLHTVAAAMDLQRRDQNQIIVCFVGLKSK